MSYQSTTGRVAWDPRYPMFEGKPIVAERFTRTDEKWSYRPKKPGFRKAMQSGKIVVNELKVGTVTAPEPDKQAVATLGFRVDSTGVIAAVDQYDLWVAGTGFSLDGINNLSFPPPIENYDALVAEALAASNAGEIDFLTTLAEAGESVAMLVQAYRTLKNPMKHFASLRRAFSSRPLPALTPRLKHLRENNIKKFMIEYKKVMEKQARRQARNPRKQYSYNPLETLNEVTNAVATLHLTWRYGIMPNVYLFESAVKLAKKEMTPVFRTRVRKVQVKELDSSNPITCASQSQASPVTWHTIGQYTQVGRDLLKVTVISNFVYKNPNERLLRHEFDFNVLKTLWEVTPLSFTIDWIVNIGDWLGSFFPPSGLHERSVMLSRKYDVVCTSAIAQASWVYPLGTQNTHIINISPCEWSTTIDAASRSDISAYLPSIELRPEINFVRAADAAALFKLIVLK